MWLKWYLTISTAPALTFGSFPLTDILAVNEPSILNTTHSVFGGITAKKKSTDVWSPLTIGNYALDIFWPFYFNYRRIILPHNHLDWIKPISQCLIIGYSVCYSTILISYFSWQVSPFSCRSIFHNMNIHLFTCEN